MKEQDGVVGRDKTLGAGRLELFSWPCLQVFTPPCLSFSIWKTGLMVQTSSVKQTSKQRTSLSSPGENTATQRVLLLSALSAGLHSCTNPAVITSFLVFISEKRGRGCLKCQ